eukprot:scaffold256260_cov31-Tisochrysis_lutea.AAC.5
MAYSLPRHSASPKTFRPEATAQRRRRRDLGRLHTSLPAPKRSNRHCLSRVNSSASSVPRRPRQLARSLQVFGHSRDRKIPLKTRPWRRYAATRATYLGSLTLVKFALPSLPPTKSQREAAEAMRRAIIDPSGFVMKPQREGGGHNLFGEALRAALKQLTRAQRSAYILMQKIEPKASHSHLLAHGSSLLYLVEGWSKLSLREVALLLIGFVGVSVPKQSPVHRRSPAFSFDRERFIAGKRSPS